MILLRRIYAGVYEYLIYFMASLLVVALYLGIAFSYKPNLSLRLHNKVEIKSPIQQHSLHIIRGFVSNQSDLQATFSNKKKLMFFKTHKCGTSSLVSVLYLYGIRRNLNFVLTPFEHQILYDMVGIDQVLEQKSSLFRYFVLINYK